MGVCFARHRVLTAVAAGILVLGLVTAGNWTATAQRGEQDGGLSGFLNFSAPAGNRPATTETVIDGVRAAVLPNGRLVTPAGTEVNVQAPKPFGMALSPDGRMLATLNSGAGPFSLTLISQLTSPTPVVKRIDVNASFMGVTFSPDSRRVYLSGGENGNLWIADADAGRIIGSVNLNGTAHPLDRPLSVVSTPARHFKGAFPGNMALTGSGRFLYVVDQGGFKVHVIDTSLIQTGVDPLGRILEPDNFAAVIGRAGVGRYPFGIGLTANDRTLLVTHVGVFQYTHLRPASPTGDDNVDYPLCFPGAGYPDETASSRVIAINKVDPRNLPDSLRDPDGIRCGYVPASRLYTVPGLGSPNAPESSSVFVFDVSNPQAPQRREVVKTGPLVGETDDGTAAYSGSHPNAVVAGSDAIYVANGNNDSISILDPRTYAERGRIGLSLLHGQDRSLKGVQPVSLALSPDEDMLYVAEAGINAIGVIRIDGKRGQVVGHIPTGWWPSSVKVSADGHTLYAANARGRGAGPNLVGENRSPKFSVLGTVNIIAVPSGQQLDAFTERVLANNGFGDARQGNRGGNGDGDRDDRNNPIPSRAGQASAQIKHIVFINKENATHDLILGDVTQTRRGVAVNGQPSFALGLDASPNHHELALRYAFSDNFFLEPSVSSDGHRWLTGQYTTESEETHWPASYGGRRQDSGDDPAVINEFPGRIGFTDANASPEPNDLNQHGGMFLHLTRHGKSVINFGNGFEFAVIDEPGRAEPTGAREHANVPMEKVVRDNSDHLFPTFNTHIPDAPLPEDPGRFNRFDRFKRVFETQFVDRRRDVCRLPSFVDLYYPNDHGGGAFDINPAGPAWGFKRFVQDNDAALGLTVELISNSPCWKDTVIFVVEDDTQNGQDHVDGHRSIFLAISPWVKTQYVSKVHTSLASIFKTANLILGLPPLNQYDAAATDLRDLFTSTPDFSPYHSQPVQFARLVNPLWLALTGHIDFSRPDRDEVALQDAIMKSEGLPRRRPAGH
ncbi:MAG TPA: bifunctional YncE family protein/alkaline phosphatase family protein [Vicinamibacterales bacterium]|nr:bifunctional YncE family protein/alkaline phosphatase family protein [Vicinamibacterales bacterium]